MPAPSQRQGAGGASHPGCPWHASSIATRAWGGSPKDVDKARGRNQVANITMAQTPEHSDDERVGCQEEELIRQAQSQVMLVGALVRDVVHLKIGLQAGKQAVRQSMLPTCASCTVVSQPTHSFLRPAVTELHNGFRACTSEVLSQPLRQPRQLPGHWRRNVIYTHTGMQAQQILGFQGFTISSGFSDRVPSIPGADWRPSCCPSCARSTCRTS